MLEGVDPDVLDLVDLVHLDVLDVLDLVTIDLLVHRPGRSGIHFVRVVTANPICFSYELLRSVTYWIHNAIDQTGLDHPGHDLPGSGPDHPGGPARSSTVN